MSDSPGHRRGAGMSPVPPPVVPVPPVLPVLQGLLWEAALRTRRTVFRFSVLVLVLVLVLWVSVFLYGTFYYSYLPAVSFTAPVHLLPPSSPSSPSSLSGNVSLLRADRVPVLAPGLPYRFSLELEVPESPVNRRLGLFQVGLVCLSRDGGTVCGSSRSSMLRYRSGLLRTLGTVVLVPVLLLGLSEQKQLLEVELLEDHRDLVYQPAAVAMVTLSPAPQVYSARLRVHAHFTGLRYLLYTFPLSSALVGVASNFLFLSAAALLGYLQATGGPPEGPAQPRPVTVVMGDDRRLQRRTQEARRRREERERKEEQEGGQREKENLREDDQKKEEDKKEKEEEREEEDQRDEEEREKAWDEKDQKEKDQKEEDQKEKDQEEKDQREEDQKEKDQKEKDQEEEEEEELGPVKEPSRPSESVPVASGNPVADGQDEVQDPGEVLEEPKPSETLRLRPGLWTGSQT